MRLFASAAAAEARPAHGILPLPPDTALKTHNLTKKFGRRVAVSDLSLRIPRGSVYGFLGLNGAGKSTTIRMLMGLLTPTSGCINSLGFDPIRDDVAMKRRVGYVPDTPSFYDWMTVEDTFRFVAHYRNGEWDDARARRMAYEFDVPLWDRTGELSKGQRAKVSLILAMAFHPHLLILDEPTLGLDPLARRQFVEGLLSEYMESGRTVLISSHLITEISGIVDHVGIIQNGALLREQPTSELLDEVRRYRFVFKDNAPAVSDFKRAGILSALRKGRELVIATDKISADMLVTEYPVLAAAELEAEELPLEDAFLELVSHGPGGPSQKRGYGTEEEDGQ